MVVILSLVGRILESDESLRFSRIAHNRNYQILESNLPLRPSDFQPFQTTPNPKKTV